MRLLAIDPGPTESGWVVYDTTERRPRAWDKSPNDDVLAILAGVMIPCDRATGQYVDPHEAVVEYIASYGMPIGQEVIDTVWWIGRYSDRWRLFSGRMPRLVYRKDVKLHLCGSARAKDANVRQALIDRFGGKDTAIGRKATPGPLYGMAGDCWQALGVAVTAAETTP